MKILAAPLCILLFFAAPLHAALPENIYGIHSWSDGANGLFNGKGRWTIEVVNTDPWPYDLTTDQAQRIKNEGFELVIRINKFFGDTVPTNSAQWDSFAAACAQKVQTFAPWCNTWIIGNEMNANFEGNVPVATYEEVYRRCRAAIHAEQPGAIVLVAALAPWNASQTGSGPYAANRQWLNYFYDLVHRLGGDADGFAIHAYGGRGGDSDPRNDDELGFGVYKRWMEIIDGYAPTSGKPVYLTEMNHAADGQQPGNPGFPLYSYPTDYIEKLFEEINNWNDANSTKIRCAAWFSYANGGFPGYNISTSSPMTQDFQNTTNTTDYKWYINVTAARNWAMYE